MKKYNLLKVIAISIIFVFLLTLFIPGSYIGYTGSIEKSTIASNGIWGIFSDISIAMQYFNGIFIFLIAVACFYGVLNCISSYKALVYKTSLKFSKRGLLITTCLFYGILAALINDSTLLILFVPFTYQVMKKIGFDNKKILSSTLVSTLIGAMCNIYNSNLYSLLSLKVETLFIFKIITFILCIFALVVILAKRADTVESNTKKASKEDLVYKSSISFKILSILFLVFLLVASIPSEGILGITVFTDFNTFLSNLKIGDYAIFGNLFGTPVVTTTSGSTGVLSALGSWTINDVSILLLFISSIVSLVNIKKFDTFVENIAASIKKVLPIAFTTLLINIVLILTVTTGIGVTIVNWITSLTKGFNIGTSTLSTIVGSALTSESYYFANFVVDPIMIVTNNKDYYPVIGYMAQSLYNIVMLVVPTSALLVSGLYYFNISYKEWFKYIKKVLLLLVFVAMVMTFIIYAMI